MSKIYIYLAGPVKGKGEAEATNWRDSMTECLKLRNENFVGVSPLRCEPPGEDGKYPVDYSGRLAQEITAKNLLDVQRCDAVLAYLPNASSIGTLQEIGWAVGLGINAPFGALTLSVTILVSGFPFLLKYNPLSGSKPLIPTPFNFPSAWLLHSLWSLTI